MPETEPQSSEGLKLQEQGGLTTQHWAILARVTPKKSKAREFANAVLDGRIDSSNFSHREYLGSRHWIEVMKRLKPFKKGVSHFLVRKLIPTKYQLIQELEVFADKERSLSYTLNDYIYDDLGKSMRRDYIEIAWNNYSKVWETFIHFTEKFKIIGKIYREGPTDKNDLFSSWLLSDDECSDIQHTSPDNLNKILLEQARQNPDLIQNRFKNNHGWRFKNTQAYQNERFGLLEEEIN